MAALAGKRFDVGLYAGATAGIMPGENQYNRRDGSHNVI
jgi:hypothetical protein